MGAGVGIGAALEFRGEPAAGLNVLKVASEEAGSATCGAGRLLVLVPPRTE